MPARSLSPYPWHRVPRLSQRIRFGESRLAHEELDVLLHEFDVEHDAALGPRKLRCGMLMSYCLRGARLGGGASDALMDEMMPAIDRLSRARSWRAIKLQMHEFIDRLLSHVVRRGQSRLQRVVRQMQADLAADPGSARQLQDYARAAKLHPDYLSRQFRRTTGQTWIELRRLARLERARRLLCATQLKISEIARRVGINDPSQFTREFHAAYGMTPREYRVRHGGG
jgi:AraC-like DNA-binding protein